MKVSPSINHMRTDRPLDPSSGYCKRCRWRLATSLVRQFLHPSHFAILAGCRSLLSRRSRCHPCWLLLDIEADAAFESPTLPCSALITIHIVESWKLNYRLLLILLKCILVAIRALTDRAKPLQIVGPTWRSSISVFTGFPSTTAAAAVAAAIGVFLVIFPPYPPPHRRT